MEDESYEGLEEVSEKLDSLEDMVSKLEDIERAVKQLNKPWYEQGGPWNWLMALGLFIFLGWIPDAWHSNTRYAIQYQVGYDQITHYYRPSDCSFMRSPIGDKKCHYERHVSVVGDNTSQKRVVIDWEKIDDDQPRLVQ